MSEPATSASGSNTFQKAAFLIYLLAVTAAFVYLLRNFLMPLFMAAVFTGLTHPIYAWLHAKTGRNILSALLTLLALLLVLVLPLGALGFVAYQEAVHFFAGLDVDDWRGRLEGVLDWARAAIPGLERVNSRDLSGMAMGSLQNVGQFVVKNSANIGLTLANNLLSFFLMLFMMFYFYVDGPRIMQRIIRWSPLKDEYERILIEKFVSVSKGTLKGILIIGVIQALIGTVLFWALGLRSPVFLGSLMIFASIIPAVGTALVWMPVAVMFLIQGDFLSAGITVFVGAVVIGSVDNLVRPVLVGKDIKMHDLLVLLSTLGGLGLFGLAGFILGPIIAALFLAIWNIFEEVFSDELQQNRQVGFKTGQFARIMRDSPATHGDGESAGFFKKKRKNPATPVQPGPGEKGKGGAKK